MSDIEFESPANRIIAEFAPKNQFGIQLLPDIAFLRQLSIQGRLRYFQGSGLTPITITPTIGETLFIYAISLSTDEETNKTLFTVTNDGNVRELASIAPEGTAYTSALFDSLVGDSIKTFTVVTNRAGGRVTVFAWVENTARIRDVTT